MIKHALLPTALLFTLALGSCNQNDKFTQPEISKSPVHSVITAYDNANEKPVVNLANSVSGFTTYLYFVQEVHQSVLQSISYGLDEVYYCNILEAPNKKISGPIKRMG